MVFGGEKQKNKYKIIVMKYLNKYAINMICDDFIIISNKLNLKNSIFCYQKNKILIKLKIVPQLNLNKQTFNNL